MKNMRFCLKLGIFHFRKPSSTTHSTDFLLYVLPNHCIFILIFPKTNLFCRGHICVGVNIVVHIMDSSGTTAPEKNVSTIQISEETLKLRLLHGCFQVQLQSSPFKR